ncbi:WD40 repeat domain-containing protein [Streptomyces sp. NPDC059466]|uniref:WD40 repeat domain-containing protein n=1 Tax=unclassified Streptomyces TaxID=2593676 RepID=UPI00367EB614
MGVERLQLQEITRFSSGFDHVAGPLLGLGHSGEPLLLSSVPDGSEVSRWDINTGGRDWWDREGMPGCNDKALVQIPGNGPRLAIATEDGIEWWDALSGEHHAEMSWEGWTIWAVSSGVLPDGRPILVGAGHDGVVYRWDPVTGAPLDGVPAKGRGAMMAVGFVPSSDATGVMVSGDEAGRVWRWNAATGEQVGEPVEGHDSGISIIQELPSAQVPSFVSSDQEGVLKRWSAATGTQVGGPIETGVAVYSLATANIGGTAVMFAAGADEIVRAWNADSGEPIHLSLRSGVVSIVTKLDGTILVATSTTQGEIVLHSCSGAD